MKPLQLAVMAWPLLIFSAAPVAAQSLTSKPTADELGLNYQSAFAGFQPYRDTPVQSWREANDTVEKIGGWRAYAKEATPVAPPSTSPPPETHHKHGGKP